MPFAQASWKNLVSLPLAKIFSLLTCLPLELKQWLISHCLLGSHKQEWILDCPHKLMGCQYNFFLINQWNSVQREMINLISTTQMLGTQ